MDILEAIVDNVTIRCGCNFTEDCITDQMFYCFPSSPNTIIYHAKLRGMLQVNASQLIAVLWEWATSVDTTCIATLSVESFCTVASSSPLELCPGDPTVATPIPASSSAVM